MYHKETPPCCSAFRSSLVGPKAITVTPNECGGDYVREALTPSSAKICRLLTQPKRSCRGASNCTARISRFVSETVRFSGGLFAAVLAPVHQRLGHAINILALDRRCLAVALDQLALLADRQERIVV